MSRENVLRFLDKVTRNEELNTKISGVEPQASAWAKVAGEEGLAFSVDDFRDVAEAVLEKKLEGEDFVKQLLAGEGELSDEQLEGVAGGARGPRLNFERALMSKVGRLGGGWASSHVKDGGDPTIGREFGPGTKVRY
jgi:predicted ribosomally synthesized peptide with nif11-like leader